MEIPIVNRIDKLHPEPGDMLIFQVDVEKDQFILLDNIQKCVEEYLCKRYPGVTYCIVPKGETVTLKKANRGREFI